MKKRCSSSPTAKKSVEQAKSAASRQPRGFGAFPKSDRSERRDGYGPYTARKLAQMDQRFRLAMARAEKVRP